MKNIDLFSEFPPISKAEWLQKVSKDLKNSRPEDMDWEISDGLQQSPFVHREDFEAAPTAMLGNGPGWEICEKITVKDAVEANAQALEALNGGAEALDLEFLELPDSTAFKACLKDVQLDFIGLHFSGPGTAQNPANIFALLLGLAKERNIAPNTLKGSISFDPIRVGGIIDWRFLVEIIEFGQASFPNFKIITVAFSAEENPAIALGQTLKASNDYLKDLTARGLSAEIAASSIQFSVPVGKQYFLEIAKIRALRLLWINMLKAWNAPLNYPKIKAHFRPEAYTDAIYTNMISGCTMAMSAVLGGATQLCVLPYDSGRTKSVRYPADFGRRIARNVQHLMKMESALDAIEDPAAGSYYIEKLTQSLAEKAWNEFRNPS